MILVMVLMFGKSLEDDLLKKNMILVMVLMSGKGLEDDLLKKKYDFGHGVGCLVKVWKMIFCFLMSCTILVRNFTGDI